MNKHKAKPLFASSTVRGATVTAIASVLVGIVPPIRALMLENFCEPKPDTNATEQCQKNIDNVIQIGSVILSALGLGGAGTAVYGRVAVGDIWTPRGLPGPDREDFMVETIEQPEVLPKPDMLPLEGGDANNLVHADIFDNPEEGI